MWNDLTKAISDVKNIFEATFLERKILINFLTYSKILDETAKVTCLQLSLLKMRHMKQLKNDNSANANSVEYQDASKQASESDLQVPELSKLGSLGATGNFAGAFAPIRKNSHTVDLVNESPSLH